MPSRGQAAQARRHEELAAAGTVIEVMSELAERGLGILHLVFGANLKPLAWQHYPDGDARDAEAGYRWYYHCHERAVKGEHGHFHLFSEAPSAAPGERPALTHLIAIGVDAKGLPWRLFTVNRWVTDEAWRPATAVLEKLSRFEVGAAGAGARVGRWLAALLRLFATTIEAVVLQRDARVAALAATGRRPNLFEDRRLEVLSQSRVSLDRRLASLVGAAAT